MKKKKPMKIETKIMILVVILLGLSVIISAVLATSWFDRILEKKVEDNITNIASFIAVDEDITYALYAKDRNMTVQNIVKKYLDSVDDITFIVVADMDSVRYSHPTESMIGEKFVGGDEKRVVEKGESYISESTGTLGRSLRAFEPIFHEGNQVGFVAVGTLTESIDLARAETFRTIFLWVLISLAVGTLGSFLIGNSIKKSLLGLEPEHIVKLFTEQASMLDAIHEGIISIDVMGNITLINESAMKILGITEMEISHTTGKYIKDVFPTSRLTHIIKTRKSEFDKEQIINGRVIVTNRVPIVNEGEVLGAIATFRDKTDVMNLAEELTGINQIVDALRANTHEFLNKIHVILGLVQLGEYVEVEKYLKSVISRQQNIITSVVKNIKDPKVAGLIFGKISRASELGITIVIDDRTKVEKNHGRIESTALIKIIGNLLENAFFALKDKEDEKSVSLFIFEDDDEIFIEVEDRGKGIEKDDIGRIFDKGYSTKDGSNGTGLHLVQNTVNDYDGSIEVDSEAGEGTIFRVTLLKEGLND
ncbi:two-component system, CitB family, sensor histidine kinase DctS [Dethiosulfatibacter aminovorans DSM 17477]|uniref:histidine kinase n=1 Tax=Dethiosulfatibacter aminovorans DSM 17477 TaxID=1121476 RepID=A0A1M6IIG0_9FIRM|nr:sensor histidine kinase [Dethiosulfatibacter aminovorans]SHJ34270.1 two-component system, CitB family, sensor histidine kinase DctS [Dethiosulfatibacter aminovorans DSM 17477]